MLSESLEGILGACGSKAACRRLQRRNADLIEAYENDEWKDCDLFQYSDHAFLFIFSIICPMVI